MTNENKQPLPFSIKVKEKSSKADKSELYQSRESSDNSDALNAGRFRFFVTPPDPSPIDKAWAIFETGRGNWPSADTTGHLSIFKQYTNALAALPLENPTERKESKKEETKLNLYKNLTTSERRQYISMQITYVTASYQVNAQNIELLNEVFLRCKNMLKLEPNNQEFKDWKKTLAITMQTLASRPAETSGCNCW